MEQKKTLAGQSAAEFAHASQQSILNPAYRKCKLILWFVRNALLVLLYVIFWDQEWVRFTLYVTVPLSVLSLVSIFAWQYLLNRKIRNVSESVADSLAREEDT